MGKEKKRRQRGKENFLDFIPVPNRKYDWDMEDGYVTVHVVHDGFYDRIAQKFFHRPRISHIRLEEFGSFLWQRMDGRRSILELADLLKEEFGDRVEPLYPRVARYMRMLQNNRFIALMRKTTEQG